MKWAGFDLVYFDHAATSFPKPLSVREAVLDAILRAETRAEAGIRLRRRRRT